MAAAAVALIVAAGKGGRFGGAKQFARLRGKPVLWHATRPFVECPAVAGARVVVADTQAAAAARRALRGFGGRCEVLPVGGKTRAQSVYNGLLGLAANTRVLVHDAARPCLPAFLILRLLAARGGAALALPVADSLRRARAGVVTGAARRDGLWQTQTPQCFAAGALRRALARFPQAADESEAMWRAGARARLLPGDARNIKITAPEDLPLAAALLQTLPAAPARAR